MKINNTLLLEYQRSLIFAGLEVFAACDMLTDVHGGQFGENSFQWKIAVVEFLTDGITDGLIKISPSSASRSSLDDAKQLQDTFSQSDPNFDPEIWMGIQFTSTDKLKQLLARNDLMDWSCLKAPLNIGFMTSILEH
ncbi:hypothetical protein WKW79_35905 [Variovorax robiniae]|uniref:Uncharacterized protein n=1 Tax=Variovorax robiniae TaxID=1836199 RepID=A0ABU8XJU8_9BURK